MDQLTGIAKIVIIGGADGITSIYVSSKYLWIAIIAFVLFITVLGFTFDRFIKNIKNRNKKKSVVYGIASAVLACLLLIFIFFYFREKHYQKRIQKAIESDINSTFIHDTHDN